MRLARLPNVRVRTLASWSTSAKDGSGNFARECNVSIGNSSSLAQIVAEKHVRRGRSEEAAALLRNLRRATPDAKAFAAALVISGASVRSCNVVLGDHARSGRASEALMLLDTMRRVLLAPDLISYSATMNACAKNYQAKAALEVLLTMRRAELKPTAACYNAAIGACENQMQWKWVSRLLREMESDCIQAFRMRRAVGRNVGTVVAANPGDRQRRGVSRDADVPAVLRDDWCGSTCFYLLGRFRLSADRLVSLASAALDDYSLISCGPMQLANLWWGVQHARKRVDDETASARADQRIRKYLTLDFFLARRISRGLQTFASRAVCRDWVVILNALARARSSCRQLSCQQLGWQTRQFLRHARALERAGERALEPVLLHLESLLKHPTQSDYHSDAQLAMELPEYQQLSSLGYTWTLRVLRDRLRIGAPPSFFCTAARKAILIERRHGACGYSARSARTCGVFSPPHASTVLAWLSYDLRAGAKRAANRGELMRPRHAASAGKRRSRSKADLGKPRDYYWQHDRSGHAEIVALEKVATELTQLGSREASGYVRIFVSHYPCLSCIGAILRFKRKLPLVTLQLAFDDAYSARF
eukprot:TRINITY_DN75073_c0_g1_i1.p1 TRINITY_DN75073_c0_g1~~TRINITY_DN75073_c0_g1_i1.p1  ORF type:complete len:592 (+),score=68.57 TRINITY_DN75073_c0_g1_i1:184-1959(+)